MSDESGSESDCSGTTHEDSDEIDEDFTDDSDEDLEIDDEEDTDNENDCGGPERELWDACSEDRVDEVRELLENGVDVNEVDSSHGTSPIHVAAEHGHLGVIQVLVVEGHADLGQRDDEGSTALHAAAMNAEENVARFLLQSGASVDSTDQDDDTPLHVSVACSGREQACINICSALIDAGAEVNARNECGWTPLHVAVENLHVWAVRLLIEAGCDVNVSDEDGETPLHIVAAKADEDGASAVLRLLLQAQATVDVPKSDGFTALMVAIMFNAASLARILLQVGADPDLAVPPHNRTARELAAEAGVGSMLAIFEERSAWLSRQLPAVQPSVLEANWSELPELADRAADLVLTVHGDSTEVATLRSGPSPTADEVASVSVEGCLTCKPVPHKAEDGSLWLQVTDWTPQVTGAPISTSSATTAAWVCASDPGKKVSGLSWSMDGVSMLLGFKVMAPVAARFAAPLCDHTTAQVLHGIRRFFRLGAHKIFLADVVGPRGDIGDTASSGVAKMLISIARRSLTGLGGELASDGGDDRVLSLEPVQVTVDGLPKLIREGMNTYVIVARCDHPESLVVLEDVTVDMGPKLLLAISKQAGSNATKLQMNRMGWENTRRAPSQDSSDGEAMADTSMESLSRAEANLTVVRENLRLQRETAPGASQDDLGDLEQLWHDFEVAPRTSATSADSHRSSDASDDAKDGSEGSLSPSSVPTVVATPASGETGTLRSVDVPAEGASRLADMIGLDVESASMWLDMAGGDVERGLELFLEMGQGDSMRAQREREAQLARDRAGVIF